LGVAAVALQRQVEELRTQFLFETAPTSDQPDALLETGKIDRLYAFPEELARLLEPLQELMRGIFCEKKVPLQHFLRGVYFTSALQEGTPVAGACQAALGDRRAEEQDVGSVARESRARKSKSYFIADFFTKKVSLESGLAQATREDQQRRQRRERILGAVAAAILLGACYMVWDAADGLSSIAAAPDTALQKAVKIAQSKDATPLSIGSDTVKRQCILRNRTITLGNKIATTSIIARESAFAAHRQTSSARRHLFLNELFRLLVGKFHERLQEEAPDKLTWRNKVRIATALTSLLNLKYSPKSWWKGPDDAPDDSPSGGKRFSNLVMELRVLAGANHDPRIDELSDQFGGLESSELERVLAWIRATMSNYDLRDDLKKHVISHWRGWLDELLKDPQGEGSSKPPDHPSMKVLWALIRARSLDVQAESLCRDVKDDLTDASIESVSKLISLLGAVDGHCKVARTLTGRDQNRIDSDLRSIRGSLTLVGDKAKLAPTESAEHRELIDSLDESVRQALQHWNNVGGSTSLLIWSSGAPGPTLAGLQSRDSAVLRPNLASLHKLLSFDPSRHFDPKGEPFWDLAHAPLHERIHEFCRPFANQKQHEYKPLNEIMVALRDRHQQLNADLIIESKDALKDTFENPSRLISGIKERARGVTDPWAATPGATCRD